MRIIAGEFRGRRLLSPEGFETRPFTDRAKQSLFDILTPVLPGATVCDCFAGTGSLGLESLSRGAVRAVFIENSRAAVSLLARNVAALRVEQKCSIIAGDVFGWARRLEDAATSGPAPEQYDIVFVDPPYRFVTERADDMRRLAATIGRLMLSAGGLAVFRHRVENTLALPGLLPCDRRTYGKMAITLMCRAE